MTNQAVSLAPVEVATAAHNNLRQRFFEASKNDARQLFIALQRGDAIPFIEISIPDKGTVRCDLGLDEACFRGKLNFSRFRRALDAHLRRLADVIKTGNGLNIYQSQDFTGIVYNHPGAIDVNGEVNFLVSGFRQKSPGVAHVTLFFLDPALVGL